MIEGSNEAQNAVQSFANAAHTMPLRHFSPFCPAAATARGHDIRFAAVCCVRSLAWCHSWTTGTTSVPFRRGRCEQRDIQRANFTTASLFAILMDLGVPDEEDTKASLSSVMMRALNVCLFVKKRGVEQWNSKLRPNLYAIQLRTCATTGH